LELAEHHSHGLLTPAKQRNASGKPRYWCPNSHQIHSFRWRDPSGRDPIGRFVGTIIGGILGGDVGAIGGAAAGGGTTWELGPGVIVGVTGGALAGSAAGVAVGGYYGGNAGDVIGDALGALASSAASSVGDALDGIFFAKPGSKPRGCPTGTKPIDQTPYTRDHERIKKGVGAGPRDWTGISPDGDVITSDENGNAINHGPVDSYLP
jgi:hypothetical protein